VKFDAPFCQLDRKRRGMRSLFLAALNCFIRNKPRVTATPQIASARVAPAGNVAFVLIRNAQSQPIKLDTTRLCEVKKIFVAIVEESFGTDWLEVTMRANCRISILNRDRLDPVDGVLQNKS